MTSPPDPVAQSQRLRLRHLTEDDAAFMLRLVNEPGWLANIGDRGVRTLEDAAKYLREGPLTLYARLGFGFWAIELHDQPQPIGICGLIRRDTLPDVDIGYALLGEFEGHGYETEAAQLTVKLARERYGLARLIAIVSPGNHASERLLAKLGMLREGSVAQGDPPVELNLWAMSISRQA